VVGRKSIHNVTSGSKFKMELILEVFNRGKKKEVKVIRFVYLDFTVQLEQCVKNVAIFRIFLKKRNIQ
jgi:hypothetical protein